MNKELFNKQKEEYEEFNRKIMRDYKEKLKEVEKEKNSCQEK